MNHIRWKNLRKAIESNIRLHTGIQNNTKRKNKPARYLLTNFEVSEVMYPI